MRTVVAASAVAALGLLVAGCSASSNAAGSPGGHTAAHGGSSSTASSATPTTPPPPPPVRFSITPRSGATSVATDAAISVASAGGTVGAVAVRGADGPVTGTLDAARTTWKPSYPLTPSSAYRITVTGANRAGVARTVTSSFTTVQPDETFHATTQQAEGGTYGVGMPIQVGFTEPIETEYQPAVERAIQVRTSVPVVGAWHWIDNEHVNFRPRDYWPAGTQVSFLARMTGVKGGDGLYGVADLSQKFTIGRSVIVSASTTTHRLHLYIGGKLAHDWPISTGKPGHDTPNGTYLTINKGNPVEMTPAGAKPGDPDWYDLMVPWATRFTWSGVFLHDAYWSVGAQGSYNVSHGCVNMHPADAHTYYDLAVPGNPVTVTDSPLAGKYGDGYTDWFLTFPQVVHYSATHLAVLAGPKGSSMVPLASVPASHARAPVGTSAANNYQSAT